MQYKGRQTVVILTFHFRTGPDAPSVGRLMLSELASMNQMLIAFEFLDNKTHDFERTKAA